MGRFHWHLPTPETLAPAVTDLAKVSPDILRRLNELGALSAGLAGTDKGTHFDAAGLVQTYRRRLADRALLAGDSLRMRLIGPEFCAFVAPLRLIAELGALPKSPQEATEQVGRLLRGIRSGTHPLRHLTVIQWLFSTWSYFKSEYQASVSEAEREVMEPLDDMPVKPHSDDSRRARLIELLQDGECSVTQAAGRLGIDTTTGMCWAAQEGIATPNRAKKIGSDVRKEFIQCLREGIDKQDAAARFEVSVQSVTRIMRTEVGVHAAWRKARHLQAQGKARNEWTALLTEHPTVSVKTLRQVAPGTYAWLYRNDRFWLSERSPSQSAARSNNSSVNWDARDEELARKVRRVGEAIFQTEPNRPVYTWKIYQALPELKAKLGAIERMPLTARALRDLRGKRVKQQPTLSLLKRVGNH